MTDSIPQRSGASCCWHDTGEVVTTGTPWYRQICCHCGTLSEVHAETQYVTNHGKYNPKETARVVWWGRDESSRRILGYQNVERKACV